MKIEVDLGNNEGREEYAIIEVVDDALEFKPLGQTFHPDTGAYDYPLTAVSVVKMTQTRAQELASALKLASSRSSTLTMS